MEEVRSNTNSLTGEEVMKKLFDILKDCNLKEQSNDIFEIASYVDNIDSKIDYMNEEIRNLRQQIKDMKEDTLVNNTKKAVLEKIDSMSEQWTEFKHNITELKDSMKKKAGSIINDVKSKGRKALVRVSEFCNFKEYLLKFKEKLDQRVVETQKTIEKLDKFGKEMRESKQVKKNAFRGLFGKEQVDYSKVQKKFSKTELAKKPFKLEKKIYQSVTKSIDGAVRKLDDMKARVETQELNELFNNLEERAKSEKAKTVSSVEKMPLAVVAEDKGKVYGAEMFEKAAKNMPTVNTTVVNEIAQKSVGRR